MITADQGDLAGLFRVAGFLMSAGAALALTVLGPPAKGILSKLVKRIAGLLTAVCVGLIWTLCAEPRFRPILILLALVSAGTTIVIAGLLVFDRRENVRTAAFLYLLLAVAGPTALSSTALLTMLPKPMELRIIYAPTCRSFATNQQVEGSWRNLPSDSHIWIVVTPRDGTMFFPEVPEANKNLNGTWDSLLSYHPERTEPGFYIRAVIATGEAQDAFMKYEDTPDRMGLERLPFGTMIGDRRWISTNADAACQQ